jgi:single-stranded-DNA-specific exonuclease
LGTRQNPGLRSLLDIAGVDTRPQAWHLGFALGPRINAGGRIASCDLGTRLLSTDDPGEAQRLAEQLHQLNTERQSLEKAVLEEAILQAEQQMASSPMSLVLASDGWHPGVVGIVASRIKDLFHRPVFVLGSDGKCAKGSGRSISGVDLGLCVQQLRPMLLAGGGHKMAAGISIEPAKVADFRAALNDKVTAQVAKSPEILTPKLSIDGLLRPGAGTLDLLEKLAQLEPYGMGNPEPRFAFSGVKIEMPRVVGDGHLQITVADLTKGRLKGIAFRAMHSDLGKFLMNTSGRMISVCGTLKPNTWQGNTTVQLHLEDAHTQLWEH